jgi:hypothetical protein
MNDMEFEKRELEDFINFRIPRTTLSAMIVKFDPEASRDGPNDDVGAIFHISTIQFVFGAADDVTPFHHFKPPLSLFFLILLPPAAAATFGAPDASRGHSNGP